MYLMSVHEKQPEYGQIQGVLDIFETFIAFFVWPLAEISQNSIYVLFFLAVPFLFFQKAVQYQRYALHKCYQLISQCFAVYSKSIMYDFDTEFVHGLSTD